MALWRHTVFSFVPVVSFPGTARQGRCVVRKESPVNSGRL
jgi:hypothetical protein